MTGFTDNNFRRVWYGPEGLKIIWSDCEAQAANAEDLFADEAETCLTNEVMPAAIASAIFG